MADKRINQFSDIYTKNILDDGSIDSGLITFSRPYNFSFSGATISTTSANTFLHLFDQSLYPSTLTSATGFGGYCKIDNALSGYYYTTIMQLYNRGLLLDFTGLFALTTLTGSTTTNFMNVDMYNPNRGNNAFNQYSISALTATVTSVHIFCFDRTIYGDHIHDGTLELYLTGSTSRLAYDTYSFNNEDTYSLTSNYNDSTSAITRFWVFADIGKIICWSSNQSIMDSFTAITNIRFRNALDMPNTTVNLSINPEEFKFSDNPSYYSKNYSTGQLPDSFFQGVGLYNSWNELIAVCKFQNPIRKSTVPITVKLILDSF